MFIKQISDLPNCEGLLVMIKNVYYLRNMQTGEVHEKV